MKKTRTIRLACAGLTLGAAAWVWAPHVTNHVTTNAVINAPVTQILSPIDGHLAKASPDVGDRVRSDRPLLRVVARRPDRARVATLKDRRATVRADLEATRSRIASFRERIDDLRERVDAHLEASVARLKAELRLTRADVAKARADLERARKQLERDEELAPKGHVSQAELDDARAEVVAARAEKRRSRARVDMIRTSLGALRNGTYVGDGFDAAPHAKRRLDQAEARLVDLRAERGRLRQRVANLDRSLARANRRLQTKSDFTPSGEGVVWNASGARGTPVSRGEQVATVLNCGRRFVEAVVNGSQFDDLAAGERVDVRLIGGDRTFEAPVRTIRGAGSREDRGYAAKIRDADPEEIRVTVDMSGVELPVESNTHCNVGRRVEVRLEREIVGWTAERLVQAARHHATAFLDTLSRSGIAGGDADVGP